MPKTLVNIKEDILMVTRKMLFEEGYENLNMRTIASNCGIATGTLYNYYKSKQDIEKEVLKTEWNMMLRRIEQGTKTNISIIDKLGIVYTELSSLMNDVHNIWLDNSSMNISDELPKIKQHKELLLKSLSERIFYLIKDENENKDYEFLSDVICRLFSLYSHSGNVKYEKLAPIIESLLK